VDKRRRSPPIPCQEIALVDCVALVHPTNDSLQTTNLFPTLSPRSTTAGESIVENSATHSSDTTCCWWPVIGKDADRRGLRQVPGAGEGAGTRRSIRCSAGGGQERVCVALCEGAWEGFRQEDRLQLRGRDTDRVGPSLV